MATPCQQPGHPTLLLAYSFHHPEAAWAGVLCGVSFVGTADPALDRKPRPAACGFVPPPGRKVPRFPTERLPSISEYFLDQLLRSFLVGDELGGCGVVGCVVAGLRQWGAVDCSLGNLSLVRPHWPGLVFLRVGDSVAGDRISRCVSLPLTRWPSVPKTAATSSRDLAVPLVDFQSHARGRLDQASWRFLLAGPDLSLLPL